jgi:hypothetical protein
LAAIGHIRSVLLEGYIGHVMSQSDEWLTKIRRRERCPVKADWQGK